MSEQRFSQDELDESLRNNIVDVIVSTPLKIQMTTQGVLEIVFYQQVGKSTVPLQTKLLFQRDAAAQLIGGLHNALQSGQITIETTETGSGLQ